MTTFIKLEKRKLHMMWEVKELLREDVCPREGIREEKKECPHRVSNLLCRALHTVGAEYLLKYKNNEIIN